MARVQRFLRRVNGTQLIILLVIVGYNLTIYQQMVAGGLGLFVAAALFGGLVSGVAIAALMQNSRARLERVLWLAGMSVMGIYVAAVLEIGFPLWVYFVSHLLFWFVLAGYFWNESRPLEPELGWDEEVDA